MKHQKQNNLGGFCEQCGGSGRSETGCQPCPFCRNPLQDLLNMLMGVPNPNDPPTHRHKCEQCGFVWEHETTGCINNTKAHTCRCGAEQWEWYKGEAANVPFYSCLKAS
jgi:hypothetical protein